MALNARNMLLYLCRVLHVSAENSYTLMQRHPLFSAALLVFINMYIFLSYINNFLVYTFPILVYTSIFVAMPWSSEQNFILYVNKGEKGLTNPVIPR
ncbi:hypothetical protein Lalb_Chr04g0252341 [Lupinus albus]|uniref:Uncharacterized protein n=1 Tax=Lupinus albus TaxID=3870 RepID=A0A6A4QLM4_LUPAL|nr:hypothetical protein Lalb_Chr04g0252341 [Lupinus albus]